MEGRDRPDRRVCARCGAPRLFPYPSSTSTAISQAAPPAAPRPGLAQTAHTIGCCLPPHAASQDRYNHRIRRIDIATKSTTTLAGTGSYGSRDGVGASAQFYYPHGIAIAPNGGFALVAVRASPAPLPHTAPSPRIALSSHAQ